MIFVNHVPGQIFEDLTSKNFGFSDGAEAFVLISSISVGLACGTRFFPGNRLNMAWKAIRRAFTLYTAHMITTIVTLVLFISGAWIFHQKGLLCEMNILALLMDPARGIPALLTLGHQIGYNNILPMYGALFLMLPLIMLLEARSPLLLLTISVGVWLVSGIYYIAPHTTLLDGLWFLNPLSWQLLFVIGFVASMHVKRGGQILAHPVLIGLARAYVLVSFIWVTDKLWILGDYLAMLGLPTVVSGFDKTFLSLPRLLHVLALAYLVVSIPAISAFLRRSANHPLTILGRQSLNIFVAGTILAMAGQVLLYVTNKSPSAPSMSSSASPRSSSMLIISSISGFSLPASARRRRLRQRSQCLRISESVSKGFCRPRAGHRLCASISCRRRGAATKLTGIGAGQ
jgi:hypothetical protein